MRPDLLNPLFAPVTTIAGVGPRVALLLKKAIRLPPGVAEPRVIDLVWHMPTGVIDRRAMPAVADAVPGTIVTLEVRVLKHRAPPRGNTKAPYKVMCEDDSARIELVFFHAERAFIERQLPEGEVRFISGRIERYGDGLQMSHPDYIVAPAARDTLPMLEPVHPLTAGLSGKVLLKALRQAVQRLPALPEWQDASVLATRNWPAFGEAVVRLQMPAATEDVSNGAQPWQRLAYDELLAGQLALALVRQAQRSQPGRVLRGDGRVRNRVLAALPFTLTPSQSRALVDIDADLAGPHRMMRLLQGDVGSGKTAVALLAMATAIEAGAQAALMAPTEVLARQHADTIGPLAARSGIRVALLTGREKGRARERLLAHLLGGDIDIVVGTHALFSADVAFRDLALAVIDEQHRFGVHQRMALQAKGTGNATNVLAMTATPIPRTLLMTHYGDLDVSRLTEKPPGRKPIVTTLASLERIEDIVGGLRRAVADGAQVYWVCPLIESAAGIGEAGELAAAEARHAHLAQIFSPAAVGLLHGAMPGSAKDQVMADFAAGAIRILVATTVIEVGVNVPNATIMVIEHAERFGLAQLHQLRGRVGRGDRQSYCVLAYKAPLGPVAEQRLTMMRETEDGFLIAEKDLELRGGGELMGARQSGAPEFRVANVPGFEELLAMARDDARLVIERDPGLASPRGQALRTLLYLFECDEAVRLFRAA